MKSLVRAAVVGAFLAASSMNLALAQDVAVVSNDQFNATTLNLAAHGEVRVAPDMATITLGVMTEARTAQEAMQQNAARMTGVVAALRRAGIAEREIQTSSINLSPQYRYEQNQPPILTGYQASNTVSIRVLELNRLGPAIDAVVASGANQIHGIGFGLQNPQVAEDEARRKAVAALLAKATLYASATGYRLDRLVNLSEGGGYVSPPPRPMPMFARAEMAQDASTPVQGGELVVRIDVSGVYQLGRNPLGPNPVRP